MYARHVWIKISRNTKIISCITLSFHFGLSSVFFRKLFHQSYNDQNQGNYNYKSSRSERTYVGMCYNNFNTSGLGFTCLLMHIKIRFSTVFLWCWHTNLNYHEWPAQIHWRILFEFLNLCEFSFETLIKLFINLNIYYNLHSSVEYSILILSVTTFQGMLFPDSNR